MIGRHLEISDSNFIFLPEHLRMRKRTNIRETVDRHDWPFTIGERIGRPQRLEQWYIIAPELSASSVPLWLVKRNPPRSIVG